MRKPGPFPLRAFLLFLGIVVLVRVASRELPSYASLQPDLLAAALFLYAPLLHYRLGKAPSWIRHVDVRRSAIAAIALAAGGTLAFAAFARLPLPFFIAPHGGENPPLVEFLFRQALLIALPEEIFFRGYLYDAFEERGWEPVLPSSLLFAAGHLVIHASWYRALTFFPGLLLGGGRKFSGNIYVPIILHLLFNLLPYFAGGPR